MTSNAARRASDQRRSKWRQQNARDRAYQRMGLWTTDGTAALALDRDEPTLRVVEKPRTFKLCDGLIEILGIVARFADKIVYSVRYGASVVQMTIEEIAIAWAHFHKICKWMSGNQGQQTTPDTRPLLPAPTNAVIALLPARTLTATAA